MPELFEFPPTRSNRAKWALEELGISYDSQMVSFMDGQQKSAEYKDVHALGVVPAYKTDDYLMFESAAIVMQLIDENPDAGLAPMIGSAERASYYQWCVFGVSELDSNLFDVMKHTMHLPEDQRIPALAARGKDRFTERANLLSNTLRDQEYLLETGFSGADIVVGYSCNWAAYTGLLDDHPILADYYNKLQQRPAFQKVFGT